MRDSQLNHDATLLAEANAHRKKGRSVMPLWRKKGAVNTEEMQRLVLKEKKRDMTDIIKKIRRKNNG